MSMRKLVRDKIPDILTRLGKKFRVYNVSDKSELIKYLLDKLDEEVMEFKKALNIEELVDILEVIDAIVSIMGWNWDDIRDIKEKKLKERGGFSKGLIVEMDNFS